MNKIRNIQESQINRCSNFPHSQKKDHPIQPNEKQNKYNSSVHSNQKSAQMNKTSDKIAKVRSGLLQKYQKIHHSEMNIYQAIFEMLDQKKSIKKIRIGLISIGKGDRDVQKIKWKDKSGKDELVRLCEQLINHFEEERDQSMRSTEKNLSQMNQEIVKMKKSLSQKGILLQFQNQEGDNKGQQKQSSEKRSDEAERDDDNRKNSGQEEEENYEEDADHNASKSYINELQNLEHSAHRSQQEKPEHEQNHLNASHHHQNENHSHTKAQQHRETEKQQNKSKHHDPENENQPQQKQKHKQKSKQAEKEWNWQEKESSPTHKNQVHAKKQEQKAHHGKPDQKQHKHQGIKQAHGSLMMAKHDEVHQKAKQKEKEKEVHKQKQKQDQKEKQKQKQKPKQKQKEKERQKSGKRQQIAHEKPKSAQKQSNPSSIKAQTDPKTNPEKVHSTAIMLTQEELQRRQKQILQKSKLQNSRNQIEWTQISMPEHETEKAHATEYKQNKSQEGKLDTLPEELDNQFYDQEVRNSHIQNNSQANVNPEQKKHQKYNPHLEILKKLSKKKKQPLPEPRNQLQGLYYSLRNKLITLFAYFLRELKTSSFSFDEYPQSLDLKTFSSYYKHFKLAQICKVSEIPKLFKKYSINGAWLDENGFLQMHSKILGIDDDALKQITKLMEDKEKIQAKFQEDLKAIKESNAAEKDKLAKEKVLIGKKEEADKHFNQFQQKLKTINTLLTDEEIKKLTRKVQPSQSPRKFENFDRQRLKKIVQTHSGIYKQDIIQKLKQRKIQKQKRHELQMNRIIEKYKANNDPRSQANSASSFNASNHSASSLHKVQGYAKRNKIRKHGTQKQNNIEEVSGLLKQKERFKSEPKLKSYLQTQTRQPEQQVTHTESQATGLEKKTQVYKELSLPKLPKRKMREQSIYESLKTIDTKAEIEMIKKMLGFDKNSNSKAKDQDQKIFNEFYSKEKLIMEKEKANKKAVPVQNRMKFT